jgi:hypothetical protein
MGLFSKKPRTEATLHAQEETPQFERVEWTKEPGLRKLYFYAIILCVASATTGYDGWASRVSFKRMTMLTWLPNSMFFNSVQNFESWKDFFGDPEGSMLGLLGALYQIGSLASIPLV